MSELVSESRSGLSRALTVDVTETAGFALLRVMQSAGPIHSNVAFSSIETRRTLHGTSSADPTELKQAIKHWAIVSDIVFTLFLRKVVHIVWRDLVQKFDVFVRVELRHFVLGGWLCAL